jgi:hypothetical protein
MAYWEDAGREVAEARWLASPGFPAARAYASVAQPTEAAGRPVTFWEYIDGRNGDRGDVAVLAEFVTGPFTVTFKDIGPLPTQYDATTEQGQDIAEQCAVTKNTSNTFTGWVSPQVEFVKGHTLQGQVLGTWAADPTGGSSGGESDRLAPGQSEVLYSCPQVPGTGTTYVEGQLISVSYGTAGQGLDDATTLQLRN